jgi:hypothetical protein
MKIFFILFVFLITLIDAQDYTQLMEHKKLQKLQEKKSLHVRNLKSDNFEKNVTIQVVFKDRKRTINFEKHYPCIEKKQVMPKIILFECENIHSLTYFIQSIKKENNDVLDVRKYQSYKLQTF